MTPVQRTLSLLFLTTVVIGNPAAGGTDSILYTRHNLSINAPARAATKRVWTDALRESDIRAAGSDGEERVCIFCHTPHHSSTTTPLWSRETANDRGTSYLLYQSDRIQAGKLQQPFGGSKLCLSCHDGTIAMNSQMGGSVFTQLSDFSGTAVTVMPTGETNLGTDLRNDHPISLSYADFLATGSELNETAFILQKGIRLEEGLYLQCSSCHDPHKDRYGNFLVLDNSSGSPLCTACHNLSGWNQSSHRLGGNGPYAVENAMKGCENCHQPHNAKGTGYLLQQTGEEDNCLGKCHNGSGYSATDIRSQFARIYSHPVAGSPAGTHQTNEDCETARYHVECNDCHNPHQANNTTPGAPYNGRLQGVKVRKMAGDTFEYAARGSEYLVCLKCHGANQGAFRSITEPPSPSRQIDERDQSIRFNADNPSRHPLMADRLGTGASLKTDYQTTMIRILCTDCHASHGTDNAHLLVARYDQSDYGSYSSTAYALCFRCHDETYILSARSAFSRHNQHVINGRIPCSFCHDPHGISRLSGITATEGDHRHLINFDTGKVTKETAVYDSVARSCSVSCHSAHYPPIANPQRY
jgi:predicted CXXCH cytochrome family protein